MEKDLNSDFQIMKCDIFNLILDELKQEFKIPFAQKTRILDSKNKNEIMIYKMDKDFIKLSDFDFKSDKDINPSFLYNLRRLFIFRYLMCLSSNNESSVYVKITEKENKILGTIKTYTPIVFKEISYERESASELSDKILKADYTRIPKNVIDKWFRNSSNLSNQKDSEESNEELLYRMIKEFVLDIDIFELKDRIRKKIQKYLKEYKDKRTLESGLRSVPEPMSLKSLESKIKHIEALLWWNNAVYERIRHYK
jgi:hypothetical protein